MTTESLKNYLSDRYKGYKSFLDEIIFPIFGKDDFEDGYDTELLDIQPERRAMADATGIKSIKIVGSIYVDVEPLQIFDITVSDHVMMERNRVGIQRLIRAVMDTVSCAFMVFHYDEESRWDWRFTFCRKGATTDENTDQKRYTFLLGPGQSCRTAADNFYKLYEHRADLSIRHIVEAFDVEALSEEFFEKYRKQYVKFVCYITGKVYEEVEKNKWVEVVKGEPHPEMYPAFGCNDKVVRDFVKRMLGRIVFLHFLQKKGWMGVEPDKEWGTGDHQFMKNLFDAATESQKDDFLDAVLEPLFDKALDTNTEDKNYIFDTGVRGLRNEGKLKFPYLNGGLFERDELDIIPTKFPRKYFSDLLEFLYEYNFTIDENDPSDAEIGVDPEMLGRIFENLLEDNKDKGAYYTKKEVVQYMTRESLIAYLQTGIVDEKRLKAIRNFVNSHDASYLNPEDTTCIDERLKSVRICDPAIGSGAYPMGLLKEIFFCRSAIEGFDSNQASLIKRHIIQQNIYGVDIEQGAVEIARLRFWLSLVVDEVTPQSLPNLDFKIQCGNSLYTSFNGRYVNLDNNQEHNNIIAIKMKKSLLVTKKNEYFSLAGEAKYKCEVEIKRLILDIVELQLCYERQSLILRQMTNGNLFEQMAPRQMSIKEEELARAMMPEHQELIVFVQDLKRQLADGNLSIKDRSQIAIPFFDWDIMLSDILLDGGFDIVIGNPPYISAPTQLASPVLASQRETLVKCKHYKKTLNEKWDLYVPFMELGIQLLRPDGVFTMIVPYPLSNQKYGKKLRRFLCEENQLMEVVDAKGFKLFKNATVENCIPLVRKGGKTLQTIIAHYHDDNTITKDYANTIEQLIQNEKTYVWNFTQLERKANKYEGMHVLGDFCYISKGMVLQADEKQSKGEFKKEDLISLTKDEIHCRKYIEAKDMEKYHVNRVRYLEYGSDRCPAMISRATFPELYIYPRIILNCLGCLNCSIDESDNYIHNHSIYCAVPWKYLHGVNNKSISSSIKRYCKNQERIVLEKKSEQVSIYYLLGLLNSRKADELLADQRGGDYHIYPEHIRNIPIPIAPAEQQDAIAGLVKQILLARQNNPSCDISSLQAQIDVMVETLYPNLTK